MTNIVTTYAEADTLLGKRTSRKVANNTYVQRRSNDTIAVRYHDTDVVTYRLLANTTLPNVITLNSGDWLTASTRERMNTFTPRHVQVFTTKGRWYVAYELVDKSGLSVPNYAEAVPYADGMTIYEPGWVRGRLDDSDVAVQDRHNRQVDRLIDRWLQGMDKPRVQRPMDECAMCVSTGVGTIVGDDFEDVGHLLAHLTGSEYPPALLKVANESRWPRFSSSYGAWPPTDMTRKAVRLYLRQRLYTGPVSLAHGRRPQFAPSWALTLHKESA